MATKTANPVMTGANLRVQDWEHRLHVLWAWRKWRNVNTRDGDEGATYRAVLDGCAVTVRALCEIIGVKCHFRNSSISDGSSRLQELLQCCTNGKSLVQSLNMDEQKYLLEVLYLANRAVAHPSNGNLDHKAGPQQMTSAIKYGFEVVN